MTSLPAVYWLSATGDEVPGDSLWLTGRERGKLEQLRFTKRRADWRLGRWTAKRAVCELWRRQGGKLEMGDVEIIAAEDGAPELHVRGAAADATVSISHCLHVGFAVLSPDGVAVGCDVEKIEPRSDLFISDYFADAEQAMVRGAADRDRPRIMNLIWSAKESTLKALRRGLERDTRGVEVRLASGGRGAGDAWAPFSVVCAETRSEFYGWWKRDGDFLFAVSCSARTDQPLSLTGGVKS